MIINPQGGGAVGSGSINVSAGTTSNNMSAVTFDNAGGVSFGLNGSVITAVAGTAAPSPVNFSAGTTSGNLGSVVFSNLNNVSFGLNGSTITGSIQRGVDQIDAGGAGLAAQVIPFGNANGVSFSIVGGSVQGSVVTAYAGLGESVGTVAGTDLALTVNSDGVSILYPKWLTTAMASNRGSDFVAATAGFNGTNATGTIASNAISVSVAAPIPIGTAVKAVASVGSTGTITRYAPEDHQHAGVAAFAVTNTGNTAGNTRSQVGTLFLAASGGITASQSTAAAGNDTVWLSVAAPVAQTNQSAIKAFGASNTGNTAGNTGVSTGIDWVIAGTDNITVSESTAVGGPNTLWLSAAAGGAGVIATAVKAVASIGSTGTITRYAPEDHQHVGVAAFAVTNTGNTLGNTRSQVGTLFLAASGGITASQSTAAAGNDTVWLSVAAVVPIGTAVKAVASVGSTGTITRYAPEDHQHAGVAAFAVTNTGNTLGNTRSQVGTLFLAGTGNITISQSTAAAGNDTVWISAAAAAGDGGIFAGAAGTTQTAGTVVWSNSNNVSFGMNASTITASASISAIKGLGASNTGNTLGNTGLSTGIDFILAGSGALTISQSTAAGNNTLWVSAPATSVITGVDPVSISTAGSTISVQLKSALELCPYSQLSLITNSTLGQSSLYFVPFDVDGVVSGSRLNVFVSLTHTFSGAPANSTGWWALGYGLYTRMTGTGTDRMSLQTSYSLSVVSISASSSTRLSATHYLGLSNATSHTTSQYGQNNASVTDYIANSLAGFRVIALPLNVTLTAGRYWLGISGQTSNQGASAILSASIMQQQLSNAIAFRPFGTSSAASNASFYMPQIAGSYSAQSAAWPVSIALTTDAIRAAPACIIPYFNISGIGTSTNLI